MFWVMKTIIGSVSMKGMTSPTPLKTSGIEARTMSGVGPMGGQGGRNDFFRKISVSGYTVQSGRLDIGKPTATLFYAHFSDKPGMYYLSDGVWATPSRDLIDYFS